MFKFEDIYKKKTKKQLAIFGAIILTGLSVPLLFENCSASPNTLTQTTAASLAVGAPFAYNVAVDTIAYMSCANEAAGNYTAGQLWTFKAAALGQNAGLQISPTFWNYASSLGPAGMAQLVVSSSSQGANAQLAIRVPSQGMQQYLQGNSPGLGESNFGLAPIDGQLQNLFAQTEGTWLNSFTVSGASTPTLFAGFLDFTTAVTTDSSDNAAYVRNLVTSSSAGGAGGYLAVDFTNSELDSLPSEGALPANSNALYGLGFQMTFGAGNSLNQLETITSSSRIVTGITEYTLATGAPDNVLWSCPYKIMIVRPGPDASTYCPVNAAYPVPAVITAMLPPELTGPSWQVSVVGNNTSALCAVPTRGTAGGAIPGAEGLCYGNDPGGAIDYNGTTACDPATSCPHYITICTRNPTL
jgi:hypothetical protein